MKIEPDADSRFAAQQLFNMYTALRQSGFNDDQAMSIVLQMIDSNAG